MFIEFSFCFTCQQKKYFIVPEHGNSTTKCIYTALEGDMIPRHLLKHATLKSVRRRPIKVLPKPKAAFLLLFFLLV